MSFVKKCSCPIVVSILAFAITSPVYGQGPTGAVDIGAWSTDRESTDTDIEREPFLGYSIGGYLTTNDRYGFRYTLDGRYEQIDDDGLRGKYGTDSVDYSGPVHTGIIGIHAGKSFHNVYVGVYGGVGFFDGYDDDHDPMRGKTLGVELEYEASQNVNLFAQLGAVSAIGDEDDNEFKGPNARVGASAQFTDRFGAAINFEMARSNKCFEDCGGDWGRYKSLGVEVNYKLTDHFDLFAAYEKQDITANDEDDAETSNIFLGIRMPFGGAKGRNNLETPMGAFNAAGWMHPLD
ncbi:MAG: hypothetical protein GY751_12385 [Bacteroidetes bacterium]|nr:hypothetical protein [Bacteroidota bacterium]